MLHDVATKLIKLWLLCWIETYHNKAKRRNLDKALPAGDKLGIQGVLLYFPCSNCHNMSRICIKMFSTLLFEKVSVAGPVQPVVQNFFRREIKTM